MNDRELIEHWALRTALPAWIGLMMLCEISGVAILAWACWLGSWAMLLPALCAIFAGLVCSLRVNRISRRLWHLQQFSGR